MKTVIMATLFFNLAYATCNSNKKLEVSFLNGVWFQKGDYSNVRDKVREIVIHHDLYNGNIEDVCFSHTANNSNGRIIDIVEVYYQKLLEVYSVDAATNFLQELFFSPNTTMTETAAELYSQSIATFIVNQETSDLSLALSELDNSFQEGRAVVLVSHSQGNLFANRLYNAYFSQEEKEQYRNAFANLQVASPAREIASLRDNKYGTYYTANNDAIIAAAFLVSTVMPTNYIVQAASDNDFINHEFIRTYLSTTVFGVVTGESGSRTSQQIFFR